MAIVFTDIFSLKVALNWNAQHDHHKPMYACGNGGMFDKVLQG